MITSPLPMHSKSSNLTHSHPCGNSNGCSSSEIPPAPLLLRGEMLVLGNHFLLQRKRLMTLLSLLLLLIPPFAKGGLGGIFLILPSAINLAFSACMRLSNSLAGSSFGSCGTSLPITASCSRVCLRASMLASVVNRVSKCAAMRCQSKSPPAPLLQRGETVFAIV